MNTTIEQEPSLVIRNVPPFRSVVFLAAGDVYDHLQFVEEDRSERTGAVSDELGGSQNSGFVSKVLRNVSAGDVGPYGETYFGHSPNQTLRSKLLLVLVDKFMSGLQVFADRFLEQAHMSDRYERVLDHSAHLGQDMFSCLQALQDDLRLLGDRQSNDDSVHIVPLQQFLQSIVTRVLSNVRSRIRGKGLEGARGNEFLHRGRGTRVDCDKRDGV